MEAILAKIKLNTELIKSLSDENTKLLAQINIYDGGKIITKIPNDANKITKDGVYTFTFPNLKEFTDKLDYCHSYWSFDSKVIEQTMHLKNEKYKRPETITIFENRLYFDTISSISFRFLVKSSAQLSGGGTGYKNDIYSISDKIELQVKFINDTLILGAKNDDITNLIKVNEYNKLSINKTDTNTYDYECISQSSTVSFCINCNKHAPCQCINTSISSADYFPYGEMMCTHKCMCSNEYPTKVWISKFKYTVNIVTREIHLYTDFA